MFTVALIGADGSGKSTLGKRLQESMSLPVKYVYMGVNIDASTLVLPTTRLALELKRALGGRPDIAAGPPDASQAKPRPTGLLRRSLGGIKSSLRLVNLVAEEWFRQGVVWYYQARGFLVLFDRHFVFDYCSRDLRSNEGWEPLSRRVHVALLKRFYPRPTLVICLDAPAEVLHARKREGTLESLEQRRQGYLRARHLVKHFAVVDANQDLDAVTREAIDVIQHFHAHGTLNDRASSGSSSAATGVPNPGEFPSSQHGDQS